MFDEKNDIDILMKSILSDAQEDVPAHVWENISSRMDAVTPRRSAGRTVMPWFWRSVSAVAAAAVVVAVVFFSNSRETLPVNGGHKGQMIAVVMPEVRVSADDFEKIRPINISRQVGQTEAAYIADAAPLKKTTEGTPTEMVPEHKSTENTGTSEERFRQEVRWSEEKWTEEKTSHKRRPSVSLIFSGSAGTNSTQGRAPGPLKSPSISTINPSPGVNQKGSDISYGLPLSFGAGVRIGLSPAWSLGTGLNYTLLSRKFFGTYVGADNDGKLSEPVPSDISNTQHYIGIPVNAYYKVVDNDRISFYAYAGGTVERCIADKYSILANSHIHTEKAKGVQLSANIGLGVEFALGKTLGLYFDPSLRYYFDCNQPKSIRTAQPLMLGLEMGLRINL